jgi:hypothetical protein
MRTTRWKRSLQWHPDPVHPTIQFLHQPLFNWEVIRRSARRLLAQRFERGATVIGLLGPLLICGWTVARPFDLRQSYHHLLQCLIWLTAWYVLFSLLYVVLVWLRPRRHREGEDLAHLPLPATHLLLQRALELGLVPVRCLLLTLPLFLIVLAYIGVPYGEQWSAREWSWSTGDEVQLLWLARVGWASANLVTATLLPLGIALAIGETVRNMFARLMLLIFPALGLYALLRFYDEHFRLPYRSTVAYDAGWFLLLPATVLMLLTFGGLLRPRQRITAALAIVLIAGLAYGIPRIDHPATQVMRSSITTRQALRSVHYSAVWLAGSVSPTRNVRLLMDRLHSNVLLQSGSLPPEPQYPAYEDYNSNEANETAAHERAIVEYQVQMKAYEQAYANQPRIPIWFGAGLLPLLIPLLLLSGLMLGAHRRGFERGEA